MRSAHAPSFGRCATLVVALAILSLNGCVSRAASNPNIDTRADPPLVVGDSLRARLLSAARGASRLEFGVVHDRAPACAAFSDGKRFYRMADADLRALNDGVREYVPRSKCPKTYTSMIAYVDSLGRPLDPSPPGYVDPQYLTVLLPDSAQNASGDIDVEIGQGTKRIVLACKPEKGSTDSFACRRVRVEIS